MQTPQRGGYTCASIECEAEVTVAQGAPGCHSVELSGVEVLTFQWDDILRVSPLLALLFVTGRGWNASGHGIRNGRPNA